MTTNANQSNTKTAANETVEQAVPFFQTRAGSAVKLLGTALVGGLIGAFVQKKVGASKVVKHERRAQQEPRMMSEE